MADAQSLFQKSNRRIAMLALAIFALDQFTKWLVLRHSAPATNGSSSPAFSIRPLGQHRRGVEPVQRQQQHAHLRRAGRLRRAVPDPAPFRSHTLPGQIAFGLIFGGIAGNLSTASCRATRHDFIYFYLPPRGGHEFGFPAFNVADSAICTGVGLIFLLTWRKEQPANRDK